MNSFHQLPPKPPPEVALRTDKSDPIAENEPRDFPVRKISELAQATSVHFEGYLDKKSQILGLWQKVC